MDIPSQEQIDAFLPPFEPVQVLDPSDPYSIGAMVGPEAFTEVRYLAHQKQLQALDVIPEIDQEYAAITGRSTGGLLQCYRCDDAETIIVALGSINGTIQDSVDELREQGIKIGSLSIKSFRPFPLNALNEALVKAERVVCVEKDLAPGLGGPLESNVRMSLRGLSHKVSTVIAGLGGRPVPQKSLVDVFQRAIRDELDDITFLDMDWNVINQQLNRARDQRHSGPIAENILRSLNPARQSSGKAQEQA